MTAKVAPSMEAGKPPPLVKLMMPPAVDPPLVQLDVPAAHLTAKAIALVPPMAFLTTTW